jgi:hypothetical protein
MPSAAGLVPPIGWSPTGWSGLSTAAVVGGNLQGHRDHLLRGVRLPLWSITQPTHKFCISHTSFRQAGVAVLRGKILARRAQQARPLGNCRDRSGRRRVCHGVWRWHPAASGDPSMFIGAWTAPVTGGQCPSPAHALVEAVEPPVGAAAPSIDAHLNCGSAPGRSPRLSPTRRVPLKP